MSQAKGKISELVARVTNRGERIVLTSRGHPKAALVSMDDLERLQSSDAKMECNLQSFFKDLDLAAEIRDRIITESGGVLQNSADLVREIRDERDEQIPSLR